MKKNQDTRYKYQFALLLFFFAAMLATACVSNLKRENSVKEKPATETASENKNGDVKKSKPRTVSTVKTENARTIDDGEEETEETFNDTESEESDSLVKKVCRKYDSCGAQNYEDCMAEAENVSYDDEVWECMLKSSCKSLKLGKPDACTGAGNNPNVYVPERPACPQIRCAKNADCPGTCYGGCKNGICLLF